MAQRDFVDAFNDCVQRIAAGESLDACLRRYPQYAQRLRPMLQTAFSLRLLRPSAAEVRQEQELIWQQLEQRLPAATKTRPLGARRRLLPLIAALIALLVLLTATWFVLTRPDLPPDELPVELRTATPLLTNTPTATLTPSPVPSDTPTATLTPSPVPSDTPTYTVTPSATATETATYTAIPTETHTPAVTPTATDSPSPAPTATVTPLPPPPTATFAPGCGAPLSVEDAIVRVLEIYPNTTIIEVRQRERFNMQVWEVRTSHDIRVYIDVACGTILLIEDHNDEDGDEDQTAEVTETPPNDPPDDDSGGGNHGDDGDSDDDDDDDSDDDGNSSHDDDDDDS